MLDGNDEGNEGEKKTFKRDMSAGVLEKRYNFQEMRINYINKLLAISSKEVQE
jgi:hypothetical protein